MNKNKYSKNEKKLLKLLVITIQSLIYHIEILEQITFTQIKIKTNNGIN